MRNFILLLAIASMMMAPCSAIQSQSSAFGLSDGEKIKQYDKYGSYQGYYRQSGDKVKEYNKTGSYQGYYKQSGNTVKRYDKTGSYQGYYRK